IIEMPDYNDYIRFCKDAVYFPKLPSPVVVKLHGSITYFTREAGDDVPIHVWQTERDILLKAKKVASVSDYTAVKTAHYLQYPKPIDVLYNGIDLPTVTPTIKEQGKVVFTGSLAPKKGIYSLAQAWNIVIKKHPYARLYIFGKGPIDKIKALLDKDAAETIFFNGHVARERLFEELASAHMAVFPSFAECFALAPMEAMACETAVIYTTRSSGNELIEHMKDGILVDPADINDIADKICYLLEKPDICARIAIAGKQKIIEQFSIPVIAANHIQYYNTVLQGEQ
ncbi:MAG: glycosyltransferase family 4 protein, partial [Taibaiella sp.]|nr:glycosyltransferase family 4 protein [Taibaiella sp.]